MLQAAFSFLKSIGRGLLAVALAFALLTASMHHWSCSAGEDAGATISIHQKAPPADQDQCLPGHCHCVCHASNNLRAEAASVRLAFADAGYHARIPALGHSCTIHPPFEPPCA